MKKFLFSILILLILSACVLSPASDVPTVAPATATDSFVSSSTKPVAETAVPICISTQPTQADIDRALGFTGQYFDKVHWQQSYTVTDGRVAVTWQHVDGFLAYLEVLIFPCGYEELDVDDYFSDENWEIILSNYESYTIEAECRNNAGMRLYELFVAADDIEYKMRYWAVNDTDTRVITFMLVFPLGFEDMMNEYAYSLFPRLDHCE